MATVLEWVGAGIGLVLAALVVWFLAVWAVFVLAQVAAMGWRLGNAKFDYQRKKVEDGKQAERTPRA